MLIYYRFWITCKNKSSLFFIEKISQNKIPKVLSLILNSTFSDCLLRIKTYNWVLNKNQVSNNITKQLSESRSLVTFIIVFISSQLSINTNFIIISFYIFVDLFRLSVDSIPQATPQLPLSRRFILSVITYKIWWVFFFFSFHFIR